MPPPMIATKNTQRISLITRAVTYDTTRGRVGLFRTPYSSVDGAILIQFGRLGLARRGAQRIALELNLQPHVARPDRPSANAPDDFLPRSERFDRREAEHSAVRLPFGGPLGFL